MKNHPILRSLTMETLRGYWGENFTGRISFLKPNLWHKNPKAHSVVEIWNLTCQHFWKRWASLACSFQVVENRNRACQVARTTSAIHRRQIPRPLLRLSLPPEPTTSWLHCQLTTSWRCQARELHPSTHFSKHKLPLFIFRFIRSMYSRVWCPIVKVYNAHQYFRCLI